MVGLVVRSWTINWLRVLDGMPEGYIGVAVRPPTRKEGSGEQRTKGATREGGRGVVVAWHDFSQFSAKNEKLRVGERKK